MLKHKSTIKLYELKLGMGKESETSLSIIIF
jgi:hypothetical protein